MEDNDDYVICGSDVDVAKEDKRIAISGRNSR